MRAFTRSLAVTVVALFAAVALVIGSTVTTAVTLTATTALIMGGTGRPNPDDFPGYVPNVAQYYLYPNSVCQPPDPAACDLQAVYTPETAWPVYGGADAPTWKQSIVEGTALFDAAVQEQLDALGPDDNLVLFGYSQSGAILAFQKESLATLDQATKDQIEIVVIGNVSRPNGGLNSRVFPFSIPIVEFPFGPPMPTDTGIQTTDIAMKWDIIADAPLYVTNPVAMLNALLGFEYVHGTYPYPTEATPNRTPGGYTTEQWQWLMDYPELYPDLVDIQEKGDTTYLTVTPTVLPLVAPLHGLGLKPLADLIEPALRVLIEQTGYHRNIPFGQDTGFRLIPIFNPITLTVDLLKAIPQGINQMIAGLRGEPTWIVPAPPETLLDEVSEESVDSAAKAEVSSAQRVSPVDETLTVEAPDGSAPVTENIVSTDGEADEAEAPAKSLRTLGRSVRDVSERGTTSFPEAPQPSDADESSSDDNSGTTPNRESGSRPDRKSGRGAEKAEKADKADRKQADTDTAA